ncbi:lasso peptide biosynthesis B2 protein [Streptomyces sp. NPDC052101]|uniref:lasso peptide biosynthesis B2 protein n=1 Tax=Streptomyces sp. NPDC052101 TaxID=3155763 RepID=UPI00342E72D6
MLDTGGLRPALGCRLAARTAVIAARLLARQPPRRIRAVLGVVRRGARPARYEQALRARREVTAVSTLCAGRYCLQRSLATALLCRMRGRWPTWCSGVRTAPFAAHAWVEAEGRPVGEPDDTAAYHAMIKVEQGQRLGTAS